ncbi:MAG: sigma-54 dependent transcriptional regulator [Bacteroidota bacterium]
MPKKHRLLVVDDEDSITFLLQTEFKELTDYEVDVAQNGTEAINLIQSNLYDVVLLDIKMPRVGGIEVLKFIKEHSPSTQVIMLTNVVDMKTAFDTVKLGAYDFISKPYETQQLLATVKRAIERRRFMIETEIMKNELQRVGGSTVLIGESKAIQELIRNVKKVAPSDAFVLIQGASGTGKELVAHMLHSEGSRRDRPFVVVNCASIPDQLLESELFGHEKGSFTNAYSAKQGLVEVANGGTLFLDEVGDISPTTQPKLLRFLETGEFRRVGGTASTNVDLRIVSATNKDLSAEVASGRFREDLLYRLNIVTIKVPPLKDRKEDIPLLVDHFLNRKSKMKRISPTALKVLMDHDWPGNIRELEHVIEGAAVLSQSDTIEPGDLWVSTALSASSPEVHRGSQVSAVGTNGTGSGELQSLEEVERVHIEKVLNHHSFNRVRSAEALGITPKTLYLKIKKYGIKTQG